MSDFSDFGPNPFQQQNTQPFRGWTNPAYAFDKRQARRELINSQRVSHWVQTGTCTVAVPDTAVSTTGLVNAEALVPVQFTQTATELPHYTYGWSLTDNSLVQTGNYPRLSAGVHDWNTLSAGSATLYQGATLGIAIDNGAVGMQFLVHFSFMALAMTNFPDASNDAGSV
jgi:hypothetical protein